MKKLYKYGIIEEHTAPLFISMKYDTYHKKTIIFDLDGTLYSFKKRSFRQSDVYKKVIENTENYIARKLKKTKREAKSILKEIFKEYRESISIGLEKRFKVDRYDYFNTVWDIAAKRHIKGNVKLKQKLIKIARNYNIVLVSDAPQIWIKHVLRELKIDNIFKNRIFSGESNTRKEFNNAFKRIVKALDVEPQYCIVFGDQEETDIIPAKKLGMKTVLVNKKAKSSVADYTIKNILEIDKALNSLKEI